MMKKIKLLILLSIAMLFIGKANLCSSTYATDGKNKIDKSKLENNVLKENSEIQVESNIKEEFELQKLIEEGEYVIPNEFNENIDKRKVMPKDVDISKKKKLINKFIDNLINCKFFKEEVIVKDIVVYKIEKDHFKKFYNKLLKFLQTILTLYDLGKDSASFFSNLKTSINDTIETATDSLKEYLNKLFKFEYNKEFIEYLYGMFSKAKVDRFKNYEQFLRIMLNVLTTVEKFIRKDYLDYECEREVCTMNELAKNVTVSEDDVYYYNNYSEDDSLLNCVNFNDNKIEDDDMLDDEKIKSINAYTIGKYVKFDLPLVYENIYKFLNVVDLTSEEKKRFYKLVKKKLKKIYPNIKILRDGLFFSEDYMSFLTYVQIKPVHIKFVFNKLVNLIINVNEMFYDFASKVFTSNEDREKVSLENYEKVDKLIKDLNDNLYELFGIKLSSNFIEVAYGSCVELYYKNRRLDYNIFYMFAEKARMELLSLFNNLIEFDKKTHEDLPRLLNQYIAEGKIKNWLQDKMLVISYRDWIIKRKPLTDADIQKYRGVQNKPIVEQHIQNDAQNRPIVGHQDSRHPYRKGRMDMDDIDAALDKLCFESWV